MASSHLASGHLVYWCSRDGAPNSTFAGRAATLSAALEACQAQCTTELRWSRLERGHWSARVDDTVFTVRCED